MWEVGAGCTGGEEGAHGLAEEKRTRGKRETRSPASSDAREPRDPGGDDLGGSRDRAASGEAGRGGRDWGGSRDRAAMREAGARRREGSSPVAWEPEERRSGVGEERPPVLGTGRGRRPEKWSAVADHQNGVQRTDSDAGSLAPAYTPSLARPRRGPTSDEDLQQTTLR